MKFRLFLHSNNRTDPEWKDLLTVAKVVQRPARASPKKFRWFPRSTHSVRQSQDAPALATPKRLHWFLHSNNKTDPDWKHLLKLSKVVQRPAWASLKKFRWLLRSTRSLRPNQDPPALATPKKIDRFLHSNNSIPPSRDL